MEVRDIRLKRTGSLRWLKITNEKGQYVMIPISLEQSKTLLKDLIRYTPSAKLASDADKGIQESIEQLEQTINKLKSLCKGHSTQQTDAG